MCVDKKLFLYETELFELELFICIKWIWYFKMPQRLICHKTQINTVSWWFLTGVWVTTSPQVSRTLLSILADHNNSIVWMVSICLLIFMFSYPFSNLQGIVPIASVTIGIIVTDMSYSILVLRQGLDIYLFLLILFGGLPGQQSALFGSFSFVVVVVYNH